MQPSITRKLEIDAGHRLLKHEGKCRNLHGHRYVFEVSCEGALDSLGRVIDFGKVKELVGGWLDEALDHGFIVQDGDPLLVWLLANNQKHYVMPVPPTAENLADLVFTMASSLLASYDLKVTCVRCCETPNCWADRVAG